MVGHYASILLYNTKKIWFLADQKIIFNHCICRFIHYIWDEKYGPCHSLGVTAKRGFGLEFGLLLFCFIFIFSIFCGNWKGGKRITHDL